jgi:peptide/nickel transport system substrate-binding protein
MIAAACGGDNKNSSASTSAAAPTAAGGAATTSGGTSTSGAGTTVPGKPGGTINYALPDRFTSYNNGTAEDNLLSNQEVLNGVQPSPSNFNGKGDIFLDENLVSLEKTSDNPLTTVYTINAKAVWSDDVPITCDDFYMSWVSQNGVYKTKDDKGTDTTLFAAASNTGFEQVKSVDCSADGKKATFTFSTPFSDWKGLIAGQNIVPAHVVAKGAGLTGVADIRKAVEANDSATIAKIAQFWNTGFKTDAGFKPDVMLSGGPFLIKDYQADQSVTLVRNDKYWGPKALPDSIVFRIIVDDTAQVQALANQEVDVIAPQPDPDLVNQVKAISGVKSEVNGGFTFEHLDMSFSNPVLKDFAVRQAVAYCTPRQDLIDKLIKPINDKAEVLQNRIFFPFQDAYKDNSGGLYDKVDIAKAKSTLEAAGYTLQNGVYAKNGQKVEFKLLHKKNARRDNEWQLLNQSCAQAGISILDDGDDNWSTRLGAGQFDAVVFAWTGSSLLSAQKALYHTPPSAQVLLSNYINYSNKTVDDLTNQLTTETDQAKLNDIGQQLDVQLWKDLPTIPLFQFPDLLAHTDKIQTVIYNPTQQSQTWNDSTWSVS